MADTLNSICLKERPGQQKTNLRMRPVEMAFTYGPDKDDWLNSEFQQKVVRLYNISQMPHRFPDVKDRPKRKLSGQPCYDWVAKRLNCSAREVQCWLSGAAEVPDPPRSSSNN